MLTRYLVRRAFKSWFPAGVRRYGLSVRPARQILPRPAVQFPRVTPRAFAKRVSRYYVVPLGAKDFSFAMRSMPRSLAPIPWMPLSSVNHRLRVFAGTKLVDGKLLVPYHTNVNRLPVPGRKMSSSAQTSSYIPAANSTCIRRQERRQVLFARKVAGRAGSAPGRNGKYRRTVFSNETCL